MTYIPLDSCQKFCVLSASQVSGFYSSLVGYITALHIMAGFATSVSYISDIQACIFMTILNSVE